MSIQSSINPSIHQPINQGRNSKAAHSCAGCQEPDSFACLILMAGLPQADPQDPPCGPGRSSLHACTPARVGREGYTLYIYIYIYIMYLYIIFRRVGIVGPIPWVHVRTPRHWYLWFLAVDPEAQGRKVGSKLLAEIQAMQDTAVRPPWLGFKGKPKTSTPFWWGFPVFETILRSQNGCFFVCGLLCVCLFGGRGANLTLGVLVPQ